MLSHFHPDFRPVINKRTNKSKWWWWRWWGDIELNYTVEDPS